MSDESDLLRLRALECLRLAADARDNFSRRTLTRMADELGEEADRIEAEEFGARARREDSLGCEASPAVKIAAD